MRVRHQLGDGRPGRRAHRVQVRPGRERDGQIGTPRVLGDDPIGQTQDCSGVTGHVGLRAGRAVVEQDSHRRVQLRGRQSGPRYALTV